MEKQLKETPSQLPIQSYLMNFPHTLSTEVPNNAWMQEMKPEDLIINKSRAYRQWFDLYSFMAGSSIVYLLPSEGNFQDLTYVANLGIHLPHIKDENVIVLSNFTSKPRIGEEEVGRKFFNSMGYRTIKSPYKFEGEADLKYLRDNIYIGGHGIRSEYGAHEWMMKEFDMDIIPLEMVDDYMYHLDCTVFPLTTETVMMCTEMYEEDEIKEIESVAEIISVNIDDAMGGICNSVRMDNLILCGSNIGELKAHDEDYRYEKDKLNTLEKICAEQGMEPIIFNLSEFLKSGALLSCLVQNLSRVDHLQPLT